MLNATPPIRSEFRLLHLDCNSLHWSCSGRDNPDMHARDYMTMALSVKIRYFAMVRTMSGITIRIQTDETYHGSIS